MAFMNRVSRFPDFARFLYDKLFPISDFFEETIYIIARFARINAQ